MVTITPLHLKQAGFSDETIIKWVDNQRPLLNKAGFSDMEINNAYGLRVINSDSLSTIEQDNKLDSLLQDLDITEDKVEKSNKNKVTVDTEKVSNNKVNQKLEKIDTNFDKMLPGISLSSPLGITSFSLLYKLTELHNLIHGSFVL